MFVYLQVLKNLVAENCVQNTFVVIQILQGCGVHVDEIQMVLQPRHLASVPRGPARHMLMRFRWFSSHAIWLECHGALHVTH